MYWSITPGAVSVITGGVQDRLVREQRERAWLAYHIEALRRMKRMPKMDKLFPKPVRKKRRTWQEQMAVMDQWATIMNARKGDK